MIDSMLINPFFERDINGFIIGSDLKTEWNNERKGISYLSSYVKNKNLENIETYSDLSCSQSFIS